MNLKEYAQEKGITLDEAKKQTGLTHWKQEVIENYSNALYVLPEVAPMIVDPVLCEVIEIASKEEMIGSIKGLGTKSKFWNRRKELGL